MRLLGQVGTVIALSAIFACGHQNERGQKPVGRPPTLDEVLGKQRADMAESESQGKDWLDRLERVFQAEQRNESWAKSKSEELNQLMAGVGLESSLRLNIDCRTAMCRIEVGYPQDAVANGLPAEMAVLQTLQQSESCAFSASRSPAASGTDPAGLRVLVDCRAVAHRSE